MSWQGQQRDAGARVEFVQTRSAAEAVACPVCEAPEGVTCQNILTGEPLGHVPAHDKRIKKARG